MDKMLYIIYGLILSVMFLFAYGMHQISLKKPDDDYRRTEASSPLFTLFKPIIQALGIFNQRILSEKSEAGYRKKLLTSGNPFNIVPGEFLAVKQLTAVAGFLFGVFFVIAIQAPMLFPFLASGFSFFLPNLTLTQAIAKRKILLFRELPYAMDVLALSMEAGLSFPMAVEQFVNKGNPSELNIEFSNLLRDIKFGMTMRESLQGLANRTDMYETRTFVTALIQADTLGVPLAGVLKTQSEVRRGERFQRAEKLAQEAPVKILFPLLFFIFPAVFIIILVPIGLNFMLNGGM